MNKTDIQYQVDHLFRQESGKMVSVLVGIFGASNFELAEDVVQESLLSALKTWKIKGIPEHPKAWLYRVSKNKAIDVLRKRKHEPIFEGNLAENKLLNSGYTLNVTMDEYWDEPQIKDDFLGMMFACCHPSISQINQITFVLKVLCGFSIQEISVAFLTSEAVISKRLMRTKKFFRTHGLKPKLPAPSEIPERINAVTSCIYLLFNEGYKSTKSNDLIRQDLIDQAIYLAKSLLENEKTRFSSVYALMALMHFHAARSKGRVSVDGDLMLLKDQNRSLWNQSFIILGKLYLEHSLSGHLSTYHLEAGIAYEHCKAKSFEHTNWEAILTHYTALLEMTNDPVIALNRALVILEKEGTQAAIPIFESLANIPQLQNYYVYHAAAGELFYRDHQLKRAKIHLQKAQELCTSPHEKNYLAKKIEELSALSKKINN